MVDSFHFDDGDESLGVDSFGREPFIVRFQALNCGKFIYNIYFFLLDVSPFLSLKSDTIFPTGTA